jgi:hypothetical protein
MKATDIELARKISRKLKASRVWQPLKKIQVVRMPWNGGGEVDVEDWRNDLYAVTVRRFERGWPLGDGPWAKLGISTWEGDARHDWREFQRIKNDTLGSEWEALELYPAESRLCDPSNYFILYAAPKVPFGFNEGRTVILPEDSIAPQRPWNEEDMPAGIRPKRYKMAI